MAQSNLSDILNELNLESFLLETLVDGVRDNIVAHKLHNRIRNLFSIRTSEMPNDFPVGEQQSLKKWSCDKS